MGGGAEIEGTRENELSSGILPLSPLPDRFFRFLWEALSPTSAKLSGRLTEEIGFELRDGIKLLRGRNGELFEKPAAPREKLG